MPLLGQLLGRIGEGLPHSALPAISRPFFAALLGEQALADAGDDPALLARLTARAAGLHPALAHVVPALIGTTMAP